MDKNYRYFIEIVEAGSISAAAKKLRVSQPALSLSLKQLESDLQTELMVRSRRGIKLTSEGRVVYDQLLTLKSAEKNLLSALNRALGKDSQINIGAIDSLALGLVPLVDTTKDSTKIRIDSSSALTEMVLRGDLDVAYIVKPAKEHGDLDYESMGNEPMHAVSSITCGPEEIRLLAYNQTSGTYRHINSALISAGLQPKPVFHSTDPYLLAEAAILGKGVAVLPESLIKRVNSPKLKNVLPKVTLYRPIVRIARQDRWLPSRAAEFEKAILANLS